MHIRACGSRLSQGSRTRSHDSVRILKSHSPFARHASPEHPDTVFLLIDTSTDLDLCSIYVVFHRIGPRVSPGKTFSKTQHPYSNETPCTFVSLPSAPHSPRQVPAPGEPMSWLTLRIQGRPKLRNCAPGKSMMESSGYTKQFGCPEVPFLPASRPKESSGKEKPGELPDAIPFTILATVVRS